MSVIFWIMLGYIIGWVAPDIMKTNLDKDMPIYLILGIAGALIGGFL